MKIYIWRRVENLTTHYHSGGGLVVIDRDWKSACGAMLALKPPADSFMECGCEFLSSPTAPDLTLETDTEVQPQVIIFEDAGCC